MADASGSDTYDRRRHVSDERTAPAAGISKAARVKLFIGLVVVCLVLFVASWATTPKELPSGLVSTTVSNATPEQSRAAIEAARRQAEAEGAKPVTVAREPHGTGAVAHDPLAADLAKRRYESLLMSPVVEVAQVPSTPASRGSAGGTPLAGATLEQIADAAVQARQRAAGKPVDSSPPQDSNGFVPPSTTPPARDARRRETPDETPAIAGEGPLHPLLEGTIINATLQNRLVSSAASEVLALVSEDVRSHNLAHVIIPHGTKVLGQTAPVTQYGEAYMAVSFHRLIFPDGRTKRLDLDPALELAGEHGLKDQVNNHYLGTFARAAAVGLLTGFSQSVSGLGYGRGDGDNHVTIIAGDVSQSTSQAMSRFLNRMPLPTITIREGHQLHVYLTHDLELPVYVERSAR